MYFFRTIPNRYARGPRLLQKLSRCTCRTGLEHGSENDGNIFPSKIAVSNRKQFCEHATGILVAEQLPSITSGSHDGLSISYLQLASVVTDVHLRGHATYLYVEIANTVNPHAFAGGCRIAEAAIEGGSLPWVSNTTISILLLDGYDSPFGGYRDIPQFDVRLSICALARTRSFLSLWLARLLCSDFISRLHVAGPCVSTE